MYRKDSIRVDRENSVHVAGLCTIWHDLKKKKLYIFPQLCIQNKKILSKMLSKEGLRRDKTVLIVNFWAVDLVAKLLYLDLSLKINQ